MSCQLVLSISIKDMLKITIELLPYGNENYKRTLSTFEIANDGTGDSKIGNYLFRSHPEFKWEKSIQNWDRATPVEVLVGAVIDKHFKGVV